MNDQPIWNPNDEPAALRAFGEWLHDEARRVFLQDGTHGQMLFLFDDDGVVSINPVPPNTSAEKLTVGVRQEVQKHNLYAVMTVAVDVPAPWPQGPHGLPAPGRRDASQRFDGRRS